MLHNVDTLGFELYPGALGSRVPWSIPLSRWCGTRDDVELQPGRVDELPLALGRG